MVRPTILIVEDEVITGMALGRELESFGYEITARVTTGAEAIAAAERVLPDAILMDINIRGDLTGIETARKIRSRFQIPIAFITGYHDREVMRLAEEVRPFGYFIKPVDGRKVHEILSRLLQKNRGDTPDGGQ